ncbi:tetratricopeptide repeat protein [Paraburkholderia sp. SARCC-3016]|uniref:O-linked N-acetylglucosamine transferase family protein n=1 Tax=Paraburkholderia sp. SARCC-3016 TaxID=3058611 RepID=UPI002807B373|nr:tetratricopeptide repeat protein [Paraburkholderia sp. SARCC-3016]MDQ7979064.1 tetratricopeptide repeat protein [Paraburkholderia sp. SARCC-3016]
MTLDATLQQAVQHHQAEAFAEAERLYRSILQAQPDHPEANHHLGMLAVQLEQHAMGLPFLKAAVKASPQHAEFRRDYVNALEAAGQHDEAARVREAGSVPVNAGFVTGIHANGAINETAANLTSAAGATPTNSAPASSEADVLAVEFVETIALLTAKGDHAGAEALAQQMVRLLPEHGFGWKTLAHAALRRSDLDGARVPLQHAVRLMPHDEPLRNHLSAAMAMHNARALDQAGRYQEAERLYRIVAACYPQYPDALHKLAVVLIRQHQPDAAVPLLENAIGIAPNQPQYWMNYVDALLQSGQTKAAWLALEMGQQRGMTGPAVDAIINLMTTITAQNLEIRPEPITQQPRIEATPAQNDAAASALALATATPARAPRAPRPGAAGGPMPSQRECDEAIAHFNKGRLDEAVAAGRSLTERFPSLPLGWKVLGCGSYRLANYDDAFGALQKASELGPLDVEVLQALVSLLMAKNMHKDAEARCQAMLDIEPDNPEGHRIMGIVLLTQGRLKEAEQHARISTATSPDASGTQVTLGAILLQQGRHAEAATVFRRALELDPTYNTAFENLNFCLTHVENVEPEDLFAEHVRYGEHFEKPLKKRWKPHRNRKDPDRPLHVGFISGDFRGHAVANFIEPVLERLANDRSVILHAYSNTPGEDQVTDRLRQHFAHWHHIFGTHNDVAAEQIRADGIDILIDLAGHTANNRLLVMAHKPAPVQATWIGYPGTTGLTAIDYFLADRFWVPSEEFRSRFTEKIVYLPAMAPFKPEILCPPVNGLPALRNGYVTFGSFNRIEKLRRDVIELWAKVLHAVPGSRMMVGSMPKDSVPEELIGWFADAGIGRERLDFKPRASVAVYLQQHYHVDILLDTFPFTGLTTTMQALWMGVPILTMPGRTVPGRSGVTALSHVGLESFVADGVDDYVKKAVAHASDVQALATLRAGMRARCEASPMFNPDLIATSFTQALRVMWRRWCEGKPAQMFDVSEFAQAAPTSRATDQEAAGTNRCSISG